MRGHLSVTRESVFIGYQLERKTCISSRSRSFGSVRSCGRSRGLSHVIPPRALRDQMRSARAESENVRNANEMVTNLRCLFGIWAVVARH